MIMAAAAAVSGETVDSLFVRTDEIEVTASRIKTTLPKASRITYVMTADEISAYPVQSVNDILKYAAGVDVRQRGPMGAQTDVGVRGGNFEQVAILLDGINICDPQTGHNSFDFPVNMDDIDHIELLEGPAGRAYGSSSLMGAINIVTKTAARTQASVHMEGGSYGYAAADASASAVKGGWNNTLSAGYGRSDGYSRNSRGTLNADLEYTKAFYKGSYNNSSISVNWHAGMSLKDWGSNTFYSVNFDDQFEHTAKTYTAIQAENRKGRLHVHPSIWWNHNQDRFELNRGTETPIPFNYHRSSVVGAALNSWFDWNLGRTALGVEVKNEDLVSGNLGEPLSQPIPIKGTERNYTFGLNRTNLSVVLEHNLTLGRLGMSIGAVGVHNTWNGRKFKVYPGVDLSYRLTERLKAFATYNTSLRLPSVTELYYSVGGYKADKHLRPEQLTAYDLGLRYTDYNGVQASVSLFYNHGTDMIDWIMDITLPQEQRRWESVNFTQVNSWGTELKATFDFETLLPGQTILRSANLAYSYINQQKVDVEGIQSRSTLEYLRHKAVAGLHLGILPSLDLGINLRYQDRAGSYTDKGGQVHGFEPYMLVDGRLQWQPQNGLILFVEGNNLTNRTYVDYGCVPQPGAWVVGGVKFGI